MAVGPLKPVYHTFVSYFLVFQMFICLFYENKFMLISGGQISNRSIMPHLVRTQVAHSAFSLVIVLTHCLQQYSGLLYLHLKKELLNFVQ